MICPRCHKKDNHIVGIDHWDDEDVVTYMKCLGCNLLFWYSSYLGKINTNWNEAL